MIKLFAVTIWLVLVTGILSAQTPDTTWTCIHEVTDDIDEGICVRQTPDGGYIITGTCVPQGLESHIDLLLLKTDALGNIQWKQTFDDGYIEAGTAVEQTHDGGFIISGRSLTGTYPPTEPSQSDAWLLKTDTNGDTLWTCKFGDNGNDFFTSVIETRDSCFIMAGSKETESLYPNYSINEEYQPDSSKAWLVKTDADGNTLWSKTFLEKSYANCVQQTSDGGFIVVGWLFPEETAQCSDVLLIKTNASGETEWTQTFGNEAYDIGMCVRETDDGYIISGQTKPTGSNYNALLIKTDLSGNVLWNKTFGGTGNDAAFTVNITSDNGYFFTGTTNGSWWLHHGDVWAFETDAAGELRWERIYDINVSDFGFCGIPTSDAGYVITGMVSQGMGGALWLAKLAQMPTGIEDSDAEIISFSLHQNYPNPFNATTTIPISLGHASHLQLVVYDIIGREIAEIANNRFDAGKHLFKFNASNFPSGVYIVKARISNTEHHIQKYDVSRKIIYVK